MNRPLAIGLLGATLAAAACGGGGGVTGVDGGDGGASDGSVSVGTLPPGWSAFDVTAAIALKTVGGAGDWRTFPKTHAFSLIVDPEAGRVIVGAGGPISSGSIDAIDGRTYRTTQPLSVTVKYADGCGGLATVAYDEISFSYDGALHGTARGHASYQTGDQVWSASVTSTVEGAADVTPPSVTVAPGPHSPLAPLTFVPSEPLPPTATLSLRDQNRRVIPLEPQRDDQGQAVAFFTKPEIVLNYEQVYTVLTDGLVDFAGLRASSQTPVTFMTSTLVPVIPADGFESIPPPSYGGAGVLHGPPLTPISGETSLVLNTGFGGGFGFLPYHLGPSVALRMAWDPGNTVLRFTTQLVATYDLPQVTFYGDIRVGSPGGKIAHVTNIEAKNLVKVTLPVDGDVYLSPLTTIDVPLPEGTTQVVSFEIAGVTSGCGLPPPPTALIIDDVRVE